MQPGAAAALAMEAVAGVAVSPDAVPILRPAESGRCESLGSV